MMKGRGARGVGRGTLALMVLLSLPTGAGAAGEKPATKQLSGFATLDQQPVTTTLIAEHASVKPGGRTRIGVYFEIQDGWHIYAKDPGDAGLPTKIIWSVPDGVRVGPLVWPKPHEFLDPGDIKTFGYAGAAVLYSPLAFTSTAGTQRMIPIHAKVEWLACKELCLPGSAQLELALPVSSNPPVYSTHAELFEQIQ